MILCSHADVRDELHANVGEDLLSSDATPLGYAVFPSGVPHDVGAQVNGVNVHGDGHVLDGQLKLLQRLECWH